MILAAAHAAASAAAADEELWALLKAGGQVIVMRHASTDKSLGDPPSFRLDDCATQRNLSAEGREEAQRLGAAFRARAIPIGRVLASQWCRCLETARLAFGEPTPWPALNSTFRNRELEPERTREVRALAGERPPGGNLVLVTHQLNIAALTSVYPAEGELVVLSPLGGGRFRVAGRLQPATLN
ncbi:MAG: histidine phosphatase family protein [Candidatus Rokuibacteriota bacterium]|nr:MAG: histidine phosphatase family protein [Candidatus Rokubacteria bacterium]